jgi:hypothetical protein
MESAHDMNDGLEDDEDHDDHEHNDFDHY